MHGGAFLVLHWNTLDKLLVAYTMQLELYMLIKGNRPFSWLISYVQKDMLEFKDKVRGHKFKGFTRIFCSLYTTLKH